MNLVLTEIILGKELPPRVLAYLDFSLLTYSSLKMEGKTSEQ